MFDSNPHSILRSFFYDHAGCSILRQDKFKIILKCATRGCAPFPLFVKIYKTHGFPSSLRDALGFSSGTRSLCVARRLAGMGIPVPRPYGAIVHRNRLGWASGSLFATEWMEHMQSLRAFALDVFRNGPTDIDVLALLNNAVGRFVALLHNEGVRSKDLNDGNFLVRRLEDGSFQIMLIDYEQVKLVRSFKTKWRLGNLAQVAACMLSYDEDAPDRICAGYASAVAGFSAATLAREVRIRALSVRARWKRTLDSRFDQIGALRTSL